ncbi:MAG: flagellar assembly protein A [Campylobacterota bacterium]|nr:flagellar assembly protein A [Campylobacterota bacterium]
MTKFTPVIKTATHVQKALTQAAKDRKIPLNKVDFDLLSVQTYFKTPKHPEWTLLDTELERMFNEKTIRSNALELRQEYEIRIRPYESNYLPLTLNMGLAANKTKSKVLALIKSGNILPCVSDIKELVKNEIYRKKLKAGLFIGLFEPGLDESIANFVDNSPCETPLENETRISIALSPGPISPIHDSIIYHYNKQEKSDNTMIDGIDANELIIEYIKPKAGQNGRSCTGQHIEVREPKTDYATFLKSDETIIKKDDAKSIFYFSKIPGYVKNEGGNISISNEVSIKAATFRGTGSIDPGKEKDITVNIKGKKSSEDSIGTGVNIDVKELNVDGTIGSNVKVKADALNVGEQTHRNSELEALEHATIKLHRGKLRAKTATIDILETGTVIAEEVKVKKMLGGEIIAHRVVIDELMSNAKITALESIEILSIFGDGNKLYIDPNKIESYHEKIETLVQSINTEEKAFKASQLDYTDRFTKHKNLAPRIKSFQKKVIAATQAGKQAMKADVLRIKQYKKSSEALKEHAQNIAIKGQEIETLKADLEKLYEADIHAKVIHHGVYNGHTQVIFVDTKTGEEYSITPERRYKSIYIDKVGDKKMINWET